MDIFGDILHSLKGIESDSINLKRSAVNSPNSGITSLVCKFREVFIMRVLTNIAIESFLSCSTDELILKLGNIVQKWLVIIDSSIDALITTDRKIYQIARLMQSTLMHRTLIKSLFFVIANDSMLTFYHRGLLGDFDELAIALYRSGNYWLRFPSGYDLLDHIGNLFRTAYESGYKVFCESPLKLFTHTSNYSSHVSTEYARITLLYSIFEHVSSSVFLNTNDSEIGKSYSNDGGLRDEDSLQTIDLQYLWADLTSSPSEAQLHSMLLSLESAYPVQYLIRAKFVELNDRILSRKRMALFSNHVSCLSSPLEFFHPDILYEAERVSLELGSKSKKQRRSAEKILEKLSPLTQPPVASVTIKLQDLPATLPMPRSLKTADEIKRDDDILKVKEVRAQESIDKAEKESSKDRVPLEVDIADEEVKEEVNKIMSLPLGTEKSIDPRVKDMAKKALLEKYNKLQKDMDRRRAKAVWQIRRLKRMKQSRTALIDIYSDPSCTLYRQVVFQSASKSIRYESQFSNSPIFQGEEDLKVSTSIKKKKNTAKDKHKKNIDSELCKPLFADSAADSNTSKETPNKKISSSAIKESPNIVATEQSTEIKASPPTDVATDIPVDIPSQKDNVFPVDEYIPIAPYNPMIQLASIRSEDNLVPKYAAKDTPQQFMNRLRSSLRHLGLEEALTIDQFLQQLSASLPISLLLSGISNNLLDISKNPVNINILSHSHNFQTGNLSMEALMLQALNAHVVPRYEGFVSYFQAMSLAVHANEIKLFRTANVFIAKDLVMKQNLVKHLLALQEFFLMSPTRCSSFLFDTTQYLVNQAWDRLTRTPMMRRGNAKYSSLKALLPTHQKEDLWSNLALTEALRDASGYLHKEWQGIFKAAKFFFREQRADDFHDRYFSALVDAHPFWPIVANHRLHSLVIDFNVPPSLRMFFSKEIMNNLSFFTRRYLEIGQLISVYRVISIEMRRSAKLVTLQGISRQLNLQLFEVLHVLQSLLRYFNDRHMTLTQEYYRSMQQSVDVGAYRMLQLMATYSKEINNASFYASEDERRLQTFDFTDFTLNSAVMLRICLNQILQEIRLFGVYILTYIHHSSASENEEDIGKKCFSCREKINQYRQNIALLCGNILEPELKEHVKCFQYYLAL